MGAVPTKKGYGHYPKSIGGRSPSLKWPHLYDLLRAKGYDKEKAARISNSRIGMRKDGKLKGLSYKQADNPKALKRVLTKYEKKRRTPKAQAAALIAACHSAACAPPPAGSGGSEDGVQVMVDRYVKMHGKQPSAAQIKKLRSGLKSGRSTVPPDVSNGRTPVEKFGMTYDPKGEQIVASVRALDGRGQIDWSKAEQTTIPVSDIPKLHANERDLKQSSIDKVVSGKEPFREGYVVKVYERTNGDRHVVDGHTRAAMYSALGKDMPVQIYREHPKAVATDPFRRPDGTVDQVAVTKTIRSLSKASPAQKIWAGHHRGMADANVTLAPMVARGTKPGMITGIGRDRGMGTALMLGDKQWRPSGADPGVIGALIAACYSKTCAPPPAGTGGSTGGRHGSATDSRRIARALIQSTSGKRTVTVTPKALISVLGEIAGDKSAMLDLGKVHVKGTHLFARSAGKIAREDMPQIPDQHRADYVKFMEDQGIEVHDTHVDPKTLKPTQSEFAGPKVGAIMKTLRSTGWPGDPILVTSDGAILDGHHRWAARVMQSFERAGITIPVTIVEASTAQVMKMTLAYNRDKGIAAQGLED